MIQQRGQYGITLIELMVTMAILGLVGGLGVTIYLQANRSFDMAEERWIMQTDMRRTATFINKTLRNSYNTIINPNGFIADEDMDEDDRYLYVRDEDGNGYGEIRYRDQDIDKLLIGKDGGEYEYSISFEQTEFEGETLRDSMDYEIIARSLDGSNEQSEFKINSALHLANMSRVNSIENENGDLQGVHFRSRTADSGSPSPQFSTFCFIATASYGDGDRKPVRILRMFRDLYLQRFSIGRQLIKNYYEYSPPVARFIADKPLLAAITRILIIPFVFIAYLIIINRYVIQLLFLLLLIYFISKMFCIKPIKVR